MHIIDIYKNNHSKGFTLIEVLVSILIGMVILAAVMAAGASILKSNSNTLRSGKLNQELSTVAQTMINELRRAGYNGGDRTILDVSLFGDTKGSGGNLCPRDEACDGVVDAKDVAIVSSVPSDPNVDVCILFAYDEDDDGTIDNDERRGFRHKNDAIETRISCNTVNCDTDCSTGTWRSMTQFIDVAGQKDRGIKITNVEFNTEKSKCLNVDTEDYWYILENTDSANFPCFEETGTVKVCVDGNDAGSEIDPNSECSNSSATAPAGGERTVEVRQVNIILEGELGYDASVKKTLTTSVKIANHQMIQQP